MTSLSSVSTIAQRRMPADRPPVTEYIEVASAIDVVLSQVRSRRWTYRVKWWLYSGREATTFEYARCFSNCTYPFLETFWNDVGVEIPLGRVEPDPGPLGSPFVWYRSSDSYRGKSVHLRLRRCVPHVPQRE